MRQAGILAAAGIVALDTMIGRIHEDHDNAARLAKGISRISGLSTDLSHVQTNVVYFDVTREKMSPDELVKRLAARCVRVLSVGPARLRAVTHYGITATDVDRTVSALTEVMQS